MVRASSIFCVARKRSSAIPTILKVNGNTTRVQRLRVISVSSYLYSPAFGPSTDWRHLWLGCVAYLFTYVRCLKPTVRVVMWVTAASRRSAATSLCPRFLDSPSGEMTVSHAKVHGVPALLRPSGPRALPRPP